MKKIIILVGIIWMNFASAKFDPPTTMDAYKDVYSRIYQDTFSETENEILERVAEHKWVKDADLSLDDIKIMWSGDVSDKYFNEKMQSRKVQLDYSAELNKNFIEEREILQFENLLRRKNKLLSIFSNDTKSDSPFDLLLDLNDIDKVLFGNASNDPDPSFKDKYSGGTSFQTKDFDNTEEAWQDERPNGKTQISTPNTTQGPGGDCISQHLTDLIPELTKLGAMPLRQGCDAHSIWEPPILMFQTRGSTNKNSKVTCGAFQMQKSEVEVYGVKEKTPIKEFSSTVSKLLFDSSCTEKVEPDDKSQLKTSYKIVSTLDCEDKKREEFNNKLLEWIFEANFDVELEHRAREEKSFAKCDSELQCFYESIKRLREETFDFLKKIKFRN